MRRLDRVVEAFFAKHPSAMFWGLICGFGSLLGTVWLTLLPFGAARSVLLAVASLVPLVPGLLLFTDHGGSVATLRGEFQRRGYTGRTMGWPDYFWRSVGFSVSLVGFAVLIGGLTT